MTSYIEKLFAKPVPIGAPTGRYEVIAEGSEFAEVLEQCTTAAASDSIVEFISDTLCNHLVPFLQSKGYLTPELLDALNADPLAWSEKNVGLVLYTPIETYVTNKDESTTIGNIAMFGIYYTHNTQTGDSKLIRDVALLLDYDQKKIVGVTPTSGTVDVGNVRELPIGFKKPAEEVPT